MPTLTGKVRTELMELIKQELELVRAKANGIASESWKKAEEEVARDLGYSDTLDRIEHIKNQIAGLQTELNMLQGQVTERSREATVEHYADLDLTVHADRWGNIYTKPEVFGIMISTYWDTLVMKKLNETMPFLAFYTSITQLHHVVKRELLLTGTFEEARALYVRFHQKITDAVGDTLPGLLAEVNSIPALERGKNEDEI